MKDETLNQIKNHVLNTLDSAFCSFIKKGGARLFKSSINPNVQHRIFNDLFDRIRNPLNNKKKIEKHNGDNHVNF